MISPKARVLVVEGESLVADEIAATLRESGCRVAGIASNSAQARTQAASAKPDLVLMDIALPGNEDALEVANHIRATLGIPIVYLIANADRRVLRRALLTAPLGWILKPFTRRELEAAIDMALFRAAMEKEHETRRHWFEAILNCIGEGIIIAGVDSKVTFLNPVAEHLTGWSMTKAAGRPLTEVFRTIDEHDRSRVEISKIRALKDDTEFREEPDDLLLVAHDRTERVISSTISPLNDAKENLMGVVVIFRDITSRRQIERRRLDRQRMEALGKLAGNIAHDFGNLLTEIAGHASSMGEYLLPHSRAHGDIKRILGAVERAAMLTKRILGVALAGKAETDLHTHPVPLGEVVKNAAAHFRESFEKKGITINVRAPKKMPVVIAETDHLLELLMDLFQNAADAMPEGGTLALDAHTQTVLKPDPKLNPRAKSGRYAVLRIRDTGAGIPPDTLERIFEPFFTTRAPDSHAGLGLSVVHSSIQRYGGWIKVASTPGGGSTFSIFLPEASEAKRKALEQPAKTPGGSILVVDDNESVRLEIRDALQKAGHKVHLAGGAVEAIDLHRKLGDQIDLAIIDVIMPEKDGKEVLRHVLSVNPAAAVIMTSGFSREYVRSRLPKGNWRFLQKPFDQDQLVNAVGRALEQKTL